MSETTPPLAEFGVPPETAQMRPGRIGPAAVNLRALKGSASTVVAKLQPGCSLWCGKPEGTMMPVRIEGWISTDLVVEA